MTVRTTCLALFGALALAGCGTSAVSNSGERAAAPAAFSSGAPAPGVGAPAEGAAVPANGAAATVSDGADGITVGSPNGEIERSVTAAYTVPQGSFLASFQQVTARGVQLGGYVVSSQTTPDASGRIVAGSVTLKIPAAQIATFLNGMPATFAASSIDFGSVDHTADFIDVNARLASANAHLTALQRLLKNATSIDDITTLEQQIEAVEEEIDTDQGQLNLLTDEVTYATATIRLTEQGAVAAAPAPVSTGVSSGWNNALVVMGVALTVVITASPLLVLALLAALAWRWIARRGLRPRSAA